MLVSGTRLQVFILFNQLCLIWGPSVHPSTVTGSWKSGTARLSSPRTRPPALPSAESFLRAPPTEVSPPAGHVQAWFCLLLWPSGAPPCMQKTLIQAPCPSCLLVLIPEILTIGEGRNIDWLVSTFVWMSHACETSDGTPTHTHTLTHESQCKSDFILSGMCPLANIPAGNLPFPF